MTDAKAKRILKAWPSRTDSLFPLPGAKGYWLRAQPKTGHTVCPYLRYAGAKLFKVQPDGMWIYLSDQGYADVVCIEVSNSIQNLNDKRSRYLPSGHSMLLIIPSKWLKEKTNIQSGKPRWEACGTISEQPTERITVPLRHLRVLFALKDRDYDKLARNYSPAGHEYYCLQSALRGRTSQKMQRFLKSMSLSSHFFTRPYKNH